MDSPGALRLSFNCPYWCFGWRKALACRKARGRKAWALPVVTWGEPDLWISVRHRAWNQRGKIGLWRCPAWKIICPGDHVPSAAELENELNRGDLHSSTPVLFVLSHRLLLGGRARDKRSSFDDCFVPRGVPQSWCRTVGLYQLFLPANVLKTKVIIISQCVCSPYIQYSWEEIPSSTRCTGRKPWCIFF